jgi:ABC-type phosphate transport system substrate-binding protein
LYLLRCLRILVCVLLMSVACTPSIADDEIVAIVHPSVEQEQISLSLAKQIFAMKLKQWPGDGPIKVFVLPDRYPLHVRFSKQILDLFPVQLRLVWDRQVFSGTGQAPQVVDSEEEMLRFVADTPGAIGYLSRQKVDEERIRMVEVH